MRTSPFAFLPLAAALLAAPSVAFAQPSEADRAEARRQFQSGVQQFQQRSFAPALEAFQAAYRIAPHPSPGRPSTLSSIPWLTVKRLWSRSGWAAMRRLKVLSSQWA